jgi:hypothetical protein
MTLQKTAELQQLVDQHLQIEHEPLLLAIYYKPDRDPQDIFLLEVIENFGAGRIDPERELFEVVFGSASGFPLEPGQELHLVLTHPEEFKKAVEDRWKHVVELTDAIDSEKYRILHQDPNHPELREIINA